MRKLCFKIANWIYKNNKGCTHNDRYIYYYVIQLYLWQISEAVLILGLSLVLNKFPEAVLCILGFLVTRQLIGGYHAKSYKACCFYSTTFILIPVYFSNTIWIALFYGILVGLILRIKLLYKTFDKVGKWFK